MFKIKKAETVKRIRIAYVLITVMLIVLPIATLVMGNINYKVNIGGYYDSAKKSMTVDECLKNLNIAIEKSNETFDADDYCSIIIKSNDNSVQFQLSVLYQMQDRLLELEEWFNSVNRSVTLFDQYASKYQDLKEIYMEDMRWNSVNSRLQDAYFIKYYVAGEILWASITVGAIMLSVLTLVFAWLGEIKSNIISEQKMKDNKCEKYDEYNEGECDEIKCKHRKYWG